MRSPEGALQQQREAPGGAGRAVPRPPCLYAESPHHRCSASLPSTSLEPSSRGSHLFQEVCPDFLLQGSGPVAPVPSSIPYWQSCDTGPQRSERASRPIQNHLPKCTQPPRSIPEEGLSALDSGGTGVQRAQALETGQIHPLDAQGLSDLGRAAPTVSRPWRPSLLGGHADPAGRL